jgi:hypothetical protein
MWLTCQHVQNEPDAGKIEKGSKGEPRKEEFNLLRVSLSGAHRVNGGTLLINSVFSVASCEVTSVRDEGRGGIKSGILENWNIGVGFRMYQPNIPSFQHSILHYSIVPFKRS